MEKLKNIPSLRFPEFRGNWEVKKLKEVADIGRGKSKHRPRDAEFLYGGKYPFIQTGDIRKAGLYLTEFTQTYSEEGLKQSKLWFEDTLCITIAANIAETSILKIKACFPDSIIGLIPSENKTTVLFVKHLFDKFKIQIQSLSQGAAQDNLNQEKLSNIEFVFPELKEQTKIASFLTAVDDKLQALKQKKTLLEHYKKGVMQKIFSQELRFKDENGNEYPDWEEKKLGEVCEMKNGYAFKSNTYSVNGKYNIVTIANVQNGYLDIKKINKIEDVPNDCLKHQILEIDDLLISLTGNVGRVCFVSELNCLLNQRVGKLIPKNISKLFLFQLLRLDAFITQMISDSQGGAQLNLSKPDIERYEIYLPSMSEQIKIANFLSAMDDKINNCQSQIEKTEVWKKGLLQQMFC